MICELNSQSRAVMLAPTGGTKARGAVISLLVVLSCCFQTCDRNSGYRFIACPNFGQILMYLSHLHQELMKPVDSHGSLTVLFVMKMMV